MQKNDFQMTSIQKDICENLVTICENPESTDQEAIKALAMKTKDILTKLETLKTDHEDGQYVDSASLANANLPQKLERFLFAVATAEGLTKM